MYIDKLVSRGNEVVVFITNGFQMRGVIVDNKPEYIVLADSKSDCMIYKHAISTIKPL